MRRLDSPVGASPRSSTQPSPCSPFPSPSPPPSSPAVHGCVVKFIDGGITYFGNDPNARPSDSPIRQLNPGYEQPIELQPERLNLLAGEQDCVCLSTLARPWSSTSLRKTFSCSPLAFTLSNLVFLPNALPRCVSFFRFAIVAA